MGEIGYRSLGNEEGCLSVQCEGRCIFRLCDRTHRRGVYDSGVVNQDVNLECGGWAGAVGAIGMAVATMVNGFAIILSREICLRNLDQFFRPF